VTIYIRTGHRYRNTRNRAPATRNSRRVAALGQWLNRSAIDYQSGINFYEYVRGSSVMRPSIGDIFRAGKVAGSERHRRPAD
jgi:hypothetical protein